MKPKTRQIKTPRNFEVLGMILNCKSGKMRDRRNRRAKDAKSSWQRDHLS